MRLTVAVTILVALALVPASASAARLATANEARAIYTKTRSADGEGFRCGKDCRWHAPIVSQANSTWAFVTLDQLDREGLVGYSVRSVLHRTKHRYEDVFFTGGGAGNCEDAARVPKRVRDEFRVKCNGPQFGAEVGGPDPVSPRARYMGDFGSGEIAGSRSGSRLERAVELFGKPAKQRDKGGACATSWTKPGVVAGTYRGHPGNACAADARLVSVKAHHAGWYTSRGLEVGDSAKTLHRLYPGATTDSGATNPILEMYERDDPDLPGLGIIGGLVIRDLRNGTVLSAKLRDGRVAALTVETILGD